MEINTQYGTREEHIATLQRAKYNKLFYVWSGQLRSDYLRENLNFAVENGFIKLTEYETKQESGYHVEWMDKEIK